MNDKPGFLGEASKMALSDEAANMKKPQDKANPLKHHKSKSLHDEETKTLESELLKKSHESGDLAGKRDTKAAETAEFGKTQNEKHLSPPNKPLKGPNTTSESPERPKTGKLTAFERQKDEYEDFSEFKLQPPSSEHNTSTSSSELKEIIPRVHPKVEGSQMRSFSQIQSELTQDITRILVSDQAVFTHRPTNEDKPSPKLTLKLDYGNAISVTPTSAARKSIHFSSGQSIHSARNRKSVPSFEITTPSTTITESKNPDQFVSNRVSSTKYPHLSLAFCLPLLPL